MKVLFIHDGPIYTDNNNNYHGIDYNSELKKRYLQLGKSVSFLMRVDSLEKVKSRKLSEIDNENFGVIKVPDFKSPKKYLKNKSKSKKIIKEAVLEHDILIIRLPSSIGIMAWKYAEKYNKRYIVELVACPYDGYRYHSNIGMLIAPYMWFRTKQIVNKSKYCIYVTESFLQKKYPTKGKEIGISDVIINKQNECNVKKRMKRIEEIDDNSTIILGTAAAVNMRYKGHEYVIEAIAKLIKSGYKIEYQLVGGGDNTYLRSIAEKHSVTGSIKFLGAKPNNEVLEWMDNIDIYIQPSLVDACPRSVIEAMSRGCMCIGSDVGGIPELIDEELIFEKANVNQIINLLQKVNKSLLLKQAKYSFRKVKSFEINELNKKRHEFYKTFLREKRND